MHRVAAIATIFTSTVAFVGASTPGFALQLNQAVNVPPAKMVPAVVETQTTSEPASAPAVDSANGSAAPAQPQAAPTYPSLAEAVAAQSDDGARSDDLLCLAGAIYYESKGEPLSGQLAVAEVIINRSKSGHFPRSICSVVTQPGQFAFVRGGHVPEIGANSNYRTALAVARVAMADAWDSPASDALYFHARRSSPGWHRTEIASIGNHVFYR